MKANWSNGKARDTYTWDDVPQDLALTSSLTLQEAAGVVWPLRGLGVHPYDALPQLKLVFGSYSTEDTTRGLVRLMELAAEVDR